MSRPKQRSPVTIGLIAPVFLLPLRRVRLMPEPAASTEMARVTS